MKNKKCPNCLCDVDVNATVCPFCKSAIKQTKLLPTSGFKAPQVVEQDITPLHNTKVTAQLPELPKKEDEEIFIETEDIKDKGPYIPKVLDIKDLPQNNDLFVEVEQSEYTEYQEKQNHTPDINSNKEFDFDGDLMNEIKAYFEMPSPKLNEYEEKHLQMIDDMSIDDIIQGSLDANKKEKQQESFGLMFGAQESEEPPSYKEIANNNIEASDKVKKIYDKVVETKDYNSYMYDTLDTSLDALGFADDKLGFGDLKKKLEEPDPTIQSLSQNIVENLNIKIPKLPIKKENKSENIDNTNNELVDIEPEDENIQDLKNEEITNLNFKFDQNKKIDISTTVNIPSFIHAMNTEVPQEEFSNENINNTKIDFDFLKDRIDLYVSEINKEDPFHRDPFEIDNIEIAEIKGYFKEEVSDELVKATEINVDIDVLKELNDFAGVNNENIEDVKLVENNEENEIINAKPVFQSKNILRVSNENIEEKEGNIQPTKIIRDVVSELEILKNEISDNLDNIEKEELPKENIEINKSTISNNWFNEDEISSLEVDDNNELKETIFLEELTEISETNLLENVIEKESEISDKTETNETLQNEEIDAEFNIPLFFNTESLESLQPLNISNEPESELEYVSLKDLINENNDTEIFNSNVFHQVNNEEESFIENQEEIIEINSDIDNIEIPPSIIELANDPVTNDELEQEKELKNEEINSSLFDSSYNQELEIYHDVKDEIISVNIEEYEIEIPSSILELTEGDNIINSELEQEKELKQEEINSTLEFKENNIQELEEINISEITIPESILQLTDNPITDSELEQEKEIKISEVEHLNEINLGESNNEISFDDEIKVPDFLSSINIENNVVLYSDIVQVNKETKDSNKISLSRLKPIEDKNNTINDESTKKVPPPPPPPTEIISPPPPPPPFIEKKEDLEINNIIPKFDDEKPKIRNPITTTLNTTLGARSTTNQDAMNYYITARDLCLKKQYGQALDELEKAVTLDPAFEQAHILLSRTYLKIKNVY